MAYSQLFHVPVSMHGRCHILLWLSEFSDAILICFTLPRYIIFTEVSHIQPEDSPIFFIEGILFFYLFKVMDHETFQVV